MVDSNKVRSKEQLKQLLGFAGFTAAVPIGGAAIQQVAATRFPSGLGQPTQILTGTGLLTGATELIKVKKNGNNKRIS